MTVESSSTDVLTEEDMRYTQTVFSQKCDTKPRVLGQEWNVQDDKLNINFSNILSAAASDIVTKKSALSLLARVFDPVGLISPIVLTSKQLFQELCKRNVSWDEQLDETFCQRWKTLIESMQETNTILIDRCYLNDQHNYIRAKSVQEHVFGDASKASYASSVYLRLEYEHDCHSVLFCLRQRPE